MVLLFFNGLVMAEDKKDGKWSLNVSVLALTPQLETWPWISVTDVFDLGYDVHPSCDAAAPGLRLGAEYRISNGLGLELSITYGLPRTDLFIEGGYVEGSRDRKRLSYFNLVINLPIYFKLGKAVRAYISPHVGLGRLSKVTSYADYPPEVSFGGDSGFIYGGKLGILWGAKQLIFTELGYSVMDITLESEQDNLVVNRSFGPLFLAVGIRFGL